MVHLLLMKFIFRVIANYKLLFISQKGSCKIKRAFNWKALYTANSTCKNAWISVQALNFSLHIGTI
ncbi:hypothetical protein AKG34_01415 [Peribacillus butanolivorans]|nr:hypothetical protein AKG34_01415 [Peribacillus butanolivorans]